VADEGHLNAFFDDLVVRMVNDPADRAAFTHLLVHCHDGLLKQIRSAIPLDYDRFISPDDVMQETFRASFEGRSAFRGRTFGEFRAWLHTIARHQAAAARDRVRAAKRGDGRRGIPWPEGDSDPAGVLLHYLARNSKSPRSVAGDNEYAGLIRHALTELDTTYRQVIELRFVEQVPHAEIGTRLGRTEDAVKMLCLRALRRLRGLLPKV
jgi:RNA polymerase sigma factor (sigma-70 family)